MIQLLRLSLWVMRRRLRSAWGLTGVTALGILSAVTLLSATALYTQALAETGVRHALFSQPPTGLHVQALAQNRPLGPEDYEELRGVADEAIQRRIGNLKVGQERFGRTQAGMPLTTNPAQQPPPLGSPSGRVFFMTGFAEHSRLLEGNWPQRGGMASENEVELEAVIGDRVANDMGYEVGTRVYITPFRAAPEQRIVLNVVGVATPINPREEYWLGLPHQFAPQTVGEILVIPAYISENDFLQVLGRRFPIAVGDFGFNVFVDPSVVTAETVDATQEALDGLETDLNKIYPRTFVFSRLGLTLEDFERDLILAKVPVYVFVSLVVIVVLYFLALITGILGRSQADELSLLRGRGGSVVQVCGVLLLAESVVATAAVAIGPPFAWLIVRFLLLPAFGDVGGGPIEIHLSGNAFWMGAVGAVLSVAVLSASAAGRARTGVADALASRSRPPAVSFFHRYYLDLLVVLAAGLLWWQFRERDGFVSRTFESRGLELDPSLILGPVLGLLAAALLLMRALPLLVRLAVWLCMRAGPGWSSVTLARLARDPVLPSSLAVMLMLAAALGVFGATFQSSLSRSQSDQARYRTGGEVTVSGSVVNVALTDRLAQIPGVQSATAVLRDSVSLVEGHTSVGAQLIAARPAELAQSAWFREDFAEATLPELLALITNPGDSQTDGEFGIPLPAGAERIGIWLETADLQDRDLQASINIWARLSNDGGRYRNVSLGGFGGPGDDVPGGWRFASGDLPDRIKESDQQWSLAAILFTTSSYVKVTSGHIHADDFTVFGATLPKEGIVTEDFESLGRWSPLGTSTGVPDRLEMTPDAAHSGVAGLTLSWTEPFSGEQRGLHISPVPLPLPAIGGPGLYPGQFLRIGQGRSSIPVEVVAVSDLFPTVTNLYRPFLLLDLDSYLSYLRLLPPGSLDTSPEEIWLSLDPGYDAQTVIAEITENLAGFASVKDRRSDAARASSNPLAGGGWDGLTGLSMAGIGLAVVTVLLLHSAASVRAGRVDTAVARALGMSSRQLFLSLAAERWMMAGAAIAAGAAIGYWPGLELVQLLDLNHTGSGSAPPMIPQVHVILLASVLAGLTAAVTASVVLGVLLIRRLSPVDVLREVV
jgi:hypothetical protein